MDDRVAWLVETYDEPGKEKEVEFGWILPNKEKIEHVVLMFTFNSYRVFPKNHIFVINGGRGVQVGDFVDGESELVCITRHQREINTTSLEVTGPDRASFLLGLKSDNSEVYIHVSEDGANFQWEDKR